MVIFKHQCVVLAINVYKYDEKLKETINFAISEVLTNKEI